MKSSFFILSILLFTGCRESTSSASDEEGNYPLNIVLDKIYNEKYYPILLNEINCIGTEIKLSDTLYYSLSSEYHSIQLVDNGVNLYSFIVYDGLNNQSYWYKVEETRNSKKATVQLISDKNKNCRLMYELQMENGIWKLIPDDEKTEVLFYSNPNSLKKKTDFSIMSCM